MKKTNDSNSQEVWRDRFLQKIFRGFSTFTLIPLISGIIAPMIIFFLPVAYSIYHLLGIPSTDVMLCILEVTTNSIFGVIICYFVLIFYFMGLVLFLLSITTMAKEKKKGQLKLIQHGTYARIRHPQNLAISLILFSAFFLNDVSISDGIETGHLISWGVFTLFLQLESLIEEKYMLKQFPDNYWTYIHKTGFFHPRLRKEKPIPPKSPNLEKKYFRKRIILNVFGFIIFYLIILAIVKILMENIPDLLYFRDPLRPRSNSYPDFHIINEIVGVLVPIGIWVVSFIITIINYLQEKYNKNTQENTLEKQKEIFTKFDSIKLRLSQILWVILIFWGLLMILPVSAILLNAM